MSLALLFRIIAITTILFRNVATAYEFKAGNKTFMKNIVKEAKMTDLYHKIHPDDVKPKTYNEADKIPETKHLQKPKEKVESHIPLVYAKNTIDEELHKGEEVLTEALRMGHNDLDEEEDNRHKKILTIPLEELASLKYPLVVKIINLDESVRRSPNITKTIKYKSKAEQYFEKIKQRRLKRQELKLNMTSYQAKHDFRVKAILDHVKEHFMSCLYLYGEVLRIKETGQIRDEAREMLKFMDEAGNNNRGNVIRSFFYKCYNEVRPTDKIEVWGTVETNNLIINYVKDPPNDGVD